MSDTNIYEILASKETWSIDEIIELLCGSCNPSSVIRGEIHDPLGELLETAANQGRFGMLCTGIDKFDWDTDTLQDSPYPDEPLDIITEFEAHYLKFIDWIEDEAILGKIQIDSSRKEKVLSLLGTLSSKRSEVSPVVIDIDYQKLAEEGLWSLTDLRFVLFGETYSSRYWPNLYHKYNANTEALMQKIDKNIHDASLGDRYIKCHKVPNRPPLIDSGRDDEKSSDLREFGYFGIYDTDESGYRSHRHYHTPDLFSVLTNKHFPIPNGLIKSLEKNHYKESIELLKTLKEHIQHRVTHEENPPQLALEETCPEDTKKEPKQTSEQAEDYFYKDGDNWFVSINGEQVSNLKHMNGMTYINALFKNYDPQGSDKGIHVIALERLIKKTPQIPKYDQMEWNKRTDDRGELTTDVEGEFERKTELKGMKNNYGCNGAEPVLTDDQLVIIKTQIKSLHKELKEAVRIADKEKEEQISGEIAFLDKYLSSNTFLGKAKPPTEEEIERARQNVQKAIKKAIKHITEVNKNLGKHLEKHIECGKICTYRRIYPLRIVKQ